jgi:DNA-binding response OmpR family regulator
MERPITCSDKAGHSTCLPVRSLLRGVLLTASDYFPSMESRQHSTRRHAILIVDDDEGLQDLLRTYLRENGFDADSVGDGKAMHEYLAHHTPDLIILDLMLPGEDGQTLARTLRAERTWPIVMISARGDCADRVVGLESGADDYLPKPFNARELLARIRAILRRHCQGLDSRSPGPVVRFGGFQFDLEGNILIRANGVEVPLTSRERTLLRALADHPDRALTRGKLGTLMKQCDQCDLDRRIDVAVAHLRRKLGEDPAAPQYIHTVRGVGYLFTPSGQRAR